MNIIKITHLGTTMNICSSKVTVDIFRKLSMNNEYSCVVKLTATFSGFMKIVAIYVV